MIDEPENEDCNDMVVDLAGKIQDRIKQLVYEDNLIQKTSFDPEDQAERIAAEYRSELVNHPEFLPVALKKMIRETSGRIARAGVQILYDAEKDGILTLIIEDGQTFKIKDDQYVSFQNATVTHFRRCAERILQSAEKSVMSAERLRKIITGICMQMQNNNVNHIGELPSSHKTGNKLEIEFSLS